MRAVNQVGCYLFAGGRRLTLQDLSFSAHLPDPTNLLLKVAWYHRFDLGVRMRAFLISTLR